MTERSQRLPNSSTSIPVAPALDPLIAASDYIWHGASKPVVVIDIQGTMHWCDVWAPWVNRYGDETLIPPEARCTKPPEAAA